MPDLYGNPLPEERGGRDGVDLYGNPITQPAAIAAPPPAEPTSGIIGTALDILGRPGYASAGFANALINENKGLGEALSTAGSELVNPTQRLSYSDVIQRAAPEFAAANPTATKAIGFLGDVALDPTTYLGAGLGLAGKAKLALKLGKGTSTLGEVISASRRAGLLTSAKTHIRNVVGTGAFHLSEEAARLPAAIADLAASIFTGRRTVADPSASAFARSAYEAATKGVAEAVDIIKKGPASAYSSNIGLTPINSGSKILDTYVNGTFRLLDAEDRVSRVLAIRRSLEEQAKLIVSAQIKSGSPKGVYAERVNFLIKNPTEAMAARAAGDAEIATFNNPNVVNTAFTAFRERLTPGGQTALDIFFPFVRTPTNIIARMLEYSPVGFGKNAVQIAKAITKKAFSEAEQRAFAQTFGRASIGSALIALGYKLYDSGQMTGLYEDEPTKSALDQAMGKPPGSIKVGKDWYQLTGFAPLGNLLAIGASLAREGEGSLPSAGDIAKIAGSAIEQQPLLQGTASINNLLTGRTNIPNELGRQAGSFVPTIASDIAEAIDTQQREKKGFAAQIQTRIPGLREQLPVATDVLGRQKQDIGPVGAFLDVFRTTTGQSIPILDELARLNQGLSGIQQKSDEKEGGFRQRVLKFGQLYMQFGQRLLDDPRYQQLP